MPGFKDEGIVLKRRNFGEADRLLTVLTRVHGKLSVLAKGVRRITSKRSGNVELANRVMMYLHQGKNFYLLTEAESLDTFQKIKNNLTLSTYAYHILELADKLTAEGQENSALYETLVLTLKKLSENPRQIFVRAFEVKALSILGFWSLENIKNLKNDLKEILSILQYSDWSEIEKIKLGKGEALELERIVRYYLEKIIEGKLKSRQLLKDLTIK